MPLMHPQDARVIERLNSRSGGCGTSNDDGPNSCYGHPNNYGPLQLGVV